MSIRYKDDPTTHPPTRPPTQLHPQAPIHTTLIPTPACRYQSDACDKPYTCIMISAAFTAPSTATPYDPQGPGDVLDPMNAFTTQCTLNPTSTAKSTALYQTVTKTAV